MNSEFDRGVVASLSLFFWFFALVVSGMCFGFPMLVISLSIMLHNNFERTAKQ